MLPSSSDDAGLYLPPGADCGIDSCSPPSSSSSPTSSLAILISLTPFILTFVLVFSISLSKLFPHLASLQSRVSSSSSSGISDGEDHFLPASAPLSLRQAHEEHASKSPRRKIAAFTFAGTLGLSAVLAELILAEVAEAIPAARTLGLRVTVPTLLVLLVGVIPFLEVQSIVGGSLGLKLGRDGKGRRNKFAWGLQMGVFMGWLLGFWWLGRVVEGQQQDGSGGWAERLTAAVQRARAIPGTTQQEQGGGGGGLSRACLERIGVIGILSMALLSGFASVSSPWHIFSDNRAYKRRPITDTDIARKQAGLDATSELLVTKKHRLRSLQRKAQLAEGVGGGQQQHHHHQGGNGIMGKVIGGIKAVTGGMGTSAEQAEIKALQVEISGLETMEANLAGSLAQLKARQKAHARDGTVVGRVMAVPQYAFAGYCVYRVLATVLTTLRRNLSSYPPSLYSPSFSSSDPISRFLGLIAKHWDPKLDQLAWARQISFLLSGVILAASANSVLQTFRLFAKWAPGLLYQAQANLALLIGQIAATYVISAALLLRSSLPKEVGRSVGDALESALEPAFVDRWFEGWFLVASGLTAVGIWIGRKVSGGGLGELGEEWDDYAGEEMGQKRS
ncbi:Abscisic acid G-protein coupled receptor-domain-containing protein [Triangularia setosa]|uniref:Abscisic acid G-protein coupled receptor-domain-containing protein n=1 Tax=Triangularia setosa TaxID=2587417 RepID=A0AAN6W2L4_9PEZI|nr:Abscisic acid G-protein coupled receptor-domain-containing protein [Podospora setosa]